MEYHQDKISCADFSQIPSIISQFTLKDEEMIEKIFNNAKVIRSATPYSFRLYFDKLEILKQDSKRHKELFERLQPELLIALPILPSEIFYVAYNKIVTCPDKNCFHFKNLFDYEKNLIPEIKENEKNLSFFEDEIKTTENKMNTNTNEDLKDVTLSIKSKNLGIFVLFTQ